MLQKINTIILLVLISFIPAKNLTAEQKQGISPLDELPAHVRVITSFGQRADFSHDSKRILFLEKTFGDAYEVEIATGKLTPVTHHYYHTGYTRALYLSNGDILLSGPKRLDPNNPADGRSETNAELWVLKRDLSGPPVPLGENCMEGPAVSRKNMKIAWTKNNCFFTANIIYENGTPTIKDKKMILDANDLPFECVLESQNFRPPDEKELLFSAYDHQGTDVAGFNIETGKVINYSDAPNQYDEPEGIFPDGKHITVECDKHNPKGYQYDDIYKLTLDGSGKTQRLTFFADYEGYKASNPVVSDDGRYMAFQYAKMGDWAGIGRGILLFDFAKEKEDSFAELDGKISKSLSRDKWDDYKKSHLNPEDDKGGHSISGKMSSAENYDEYIGKFARGEVESEFIEITKSKEGRYFVGLEGHTIPAVANNKCIFFTTGDVVYSALPRLGNKPYCDLEMGMVILVKDTYYFGSPGSSAKMWMKLSLIKE